MGSTEALSRPRKWQMPCLGMEDYRLRHQQHFRKAGEEIASELPVPAWAPVNEDKGMRLPHLKDTTRFVDLMASVAEQEASREKFRDIYDDEWCLRWLKSRGSIQLPEGEGRRVRQRAARHRWDEATDEVYLVTHDGKTLRIPKPAVRLDLVKEYHARTGHWGIRRTKNLLWQRNWWADIHKDVEAVVTQYETCQRVKTHYAREEAMLSPLDIKSFMYRWSLDLS